ncbi:similar to Saccharomyces cerevisiae YBR263W SHM1 Mitochondrial serine hydroxymethyltransferase, converts serine to glycine plus 5,10 methylenetetrahydrofolate [Maudiozyma saulgeensis]|uniref:Serine hydroxymethyltransferase n=1 Tax=Maudiozyma saulgeensis TaxID=1789683 RepID=A0A1X7R0S9_9SACH|nr:similar to Saccharomyces cerevisiae YBR263W SHM1 Mitochondrial serine hydroxymethyltransferase, converts serine to glycine plus 5,10 methylenetetrahydrofolate [Kazachstania saulgeensis]
MFTKIVRTTPVSSSRLAIARSLRNGYATKATPTADQVLISKHVQDVDPEMHKILTNEKLRQKHSITLIPSENFTSKSVMDLLGSEFQNKYSEGYPGARYYGGNQFIDQMESLCQKRALDLYKLDPSKWGVNVQPLSGAPANLYTYSAIMNVGDRLMGLDLPHGGHLSHGYRLNSGTPISFISKYFQSMPYRLNLDTGLIDYDQLSLTSKLFRPKVIVAGTSAYSRLIDYERFAEISKECGAYLMSDMAHISGLVAAGIIPSPFEHSDIVTTTTHKSLRGPRGAMIFYRKGVKKVVKGKEIMYDFDKKINFSVFPGHQGGPHNHTISALSVALKQATTPEFIKYQKQIVSNAKSFEKALEKNGFQMVSGGTDNHLILIDLRETGIDGARLESLLQEINIAANKNTIPSDKSAMFPSGLRVGTPAMTTRGFANEDFERVANYIGQAVTLAKQLRANENPDNKDHRSKLNNFKELCKESPEVQNLSKEIYEWAGSFPVPGEL